MKLISESLLDAITQQARENPRRRMNHNLHDSMDAPVHRLLNALEPDTYLPPHRHTDKDETYLVLRGSLTTFFFDEAGRVTEKICLTPPKRQLWSGDSCRYLAQLGGGRDGYGNLRSEERTLSPVGWGRPCCLGARCFGRRSCESLLEKDAQSLKILP